MKYLIYEDETESTLTLNLGYSDIFQKNVIVTSNYDDKIDYNITQQGLIVLKNLTKDREYSVFVVDKVNELIATGTFLFQGKTPENVLKKYSLDNEEELQNVINKVKNESIRSSIIKIFNIYTSLKTQELVPFYRKLLELYINEFNIYVNSYNSDDDLDFYINLDLPILKIENRDNEKEKEVDITITSCTQPSFNIFKDLKDISNGIKLSEDLYEVIIAEKGRHSISRTFFYISFSEDYSNQKFLEHQNNIKNKENEIKNSKFCLKRDFNFKDEDEVNIISILDISNEKEANLLYPAPKIFVKDKRKIYLEKQDLIKSEHLILYFVEEDGFFKNNYGVCREISLYNYSKEINIELTNILNFNNERYYCWFSDYRETTPGTHRVSPITTFDVTNEDSKDYTEIYEKAKWQKFISNFARVIDVNSQAYAFLKSVIDDITEYEDVAYQNQEELLKKKVIEKCTDKSILIECIKAIELVFLLYKYKYDFDTLEEITFKQNYNSIVVKSNNVFMIIKEEIDFGKKLYSKESKYKTDTTFKEYYIDRDPQKITIYKFLTNESRFSDFIMVYYKNNNPIPQIFSSNIGTAKINGL